MIALFFVELLKNISAAKMTMTTAKMKMTIFLGHS